MNIKSILKFAGIAILAILLFDVVGALVAYAHQPAVSESVRESFAPQTFYESNGSIERAAIIEDNSDALLQRVRLIESAEENIILSTYSFHADDSGRILIGALLDAADRGVKVQVLVDGLESWISMERNSCFYSLSSHDNVTVKLYNRFNVLKPWKSMGRLHDKYLVSDRQLYIMGGRNSTNRFLGDYPGAKNHDRDVLVYCKNPQPGSSVQQLIQYFETIWNGKDCSVFHPNPKHNTSLIRAAEDAANCYQVYRAAHLETISSRDFEKDTMETQGIYLITNPTYTAAKEPTAWYMLTELMKTARERVKIHTPYIICNEDMYGALEEIADCVPEFSIMTNSAANNGNIFGSADYVKNRERIIQTGANVWEYEGGTSYHGKSILIDQEFSIVGSFNLDMRSTYLDTELMLVIHSREVSNQLEQNMMHYERNSRQALPGGLYGDPNQVEPIPMSKTKSAANFLIRHLLGWARFLF